MRRVHQALVGAVSVAVLGGGFAWTKLAGTQAGQAQGVSSAAATLHSEAIVVDGHVHITELEYFQGIDAFKEQETGLFDYARAKQGGLDVVVHAVYVNDGYNLYNYGVKHALRLIEQFYRTLEANRDKMELALTSADMRRIVGSGKIAAILTIEGNPDMEGDLDVLRMWHRLGVRMLQLTSHNSTNALIDSRNDEHVWGGISDKGRAFIREMNRLGIIVDISHTSEAATLQAIEASLAPVVSTHSTSQYAATAFREGSQSPKVLKALAAKGGMLALHSWAAGSKALDDWRERNGGVALFQSTGGVKALNDSRERTQARQDSGPRAAGEFMSTARSATLNLPNSGIRPPEDRRGEYIAALDAETRDYKLRRITPNAPAEEYGTPWRTLQALEIEAGVPLTTYVDWAEHARATVQAIGDDYVGIGLDLMAKPLMRDFTAASYGRLTEAMLAKGMSPASVKKVLGENWLRVLDEAKVPSALSESRTHNITGAPR